MLQLRYVSQATDIGTKQNIGEIKMALDFIKETVDFIKFINKELT